MFSVRQGFHCPLAVGERQGEGFRKPTNSKLKKSELMCGAYAVYRVFPMCGSHQPGLERQQKTPWLKMNYI